LREGVDPNSKTTNGEPLLLLAASVDGGEKVVRLMLDAGADVDARDGSGNTPLIASAADDRIKIVQLLIDRGADVNARNRDGDTPLTNAACWGAERVTKLLLARGANPRLTDGQDTSAAMLAETHGHGSIVSVLQKAERPKHR
jgi:ankyrin repeat protein